MEAENGESKMKNYEILEQIGKGPLGASFLLLHKSQNNKYVMKKIPLAKHTEKLKRTAHQMTNLMTKLHHPYIVEVKEAWIDKGTYLCVVTDYCEGGDMTEIMKKTRGKPFSEEKLCRWMTQLLLAIDYLHSNRVVHGDLKCSNIFVTKENDICIGGFGLSKLLINEDSPPSAIFNRKVVGMPPPNFLCPELLENIPFGYKSDMWSLGCCIFEMAAYQPAFKAPDMAGLINKINRSLISPLPIVYSSTLRQIIKIMLRKTPEHRPTAADLLRHPHIQPYLLICHNLGPVFLPVFPSPNYKSRRRLSSCGSTTSSKDNIETDPIPKTLEKSTLIARKKVDFTSYSPSVSNYSEASLGTKSNDLHGEEMNIGEEEMNITSPKAKIEEEQEIIEVEYETHEKALEKVDDVANEKARADVLESLLELCARLLKQDKLDELASVLKPFGEEAVSSRETAIWLTKSLIKYSSP